jgi:hypothetical protein
VLSIGTRPLGREPGRESDPFEFLAPWVIVSPEERARLDRDQVLIRTLSGKDGQLAIFVATRLNAQPDVLVAWTRAIAELKQSKYVLAIRRFADPPSPSDLEQLTLDERDLDAIRRCRPGACGLKLPAADIESLTAVVAGAGAGWRDAAQREFRRLLAERVIKYRAGGLASLSPPADRKNPRRAEDGLSAIVEQSPYLSKLPSVVAWLKEYPHADSGVESFFYWSKEHYGQGKPVISVTHVGIVGPQADHRLPAILVAGKQIFATHYMEGGLSLTMVLRDATNGTPYLVYINRSQVDMLRGFFGGFVRSVLEDRLERQAPQIVRGLRTRLESGPPHEQAGDLFASESRGIADGRGTSTSQTGSSWAASISCTVIPPMMCDRSKSIAIGSFSMGAGTSSTITKASQATSSIGTIWRR